MRPTLSTSVMRRPRLVATAALATASLALTGLGVGSAIADSGTPSSTAPPTAAVGILLSTPTPTPKLTPAPPTPTPLPQYTGTLCVDPAPGAVEKTYAIKSASSAGATVSWNTGFGCFPLPVRIITELDGVKVSETVSPQTAGQVSIPGPLEEGRSYRVKITAIFANPPGSSGGGKVLGDFDLVIPWADPLPTPTPTPTFTPTPRPTLLPSYPGICIDPPRNTTPPTFTLKEVTSTTARVDWFVGGGCYEMPIVTTLFVNNVQRERTVGGPSTFSGSYTVTGLEPGTTHRVRITAQYRSVGSSSFTTKVLGDQDITTPLVDPTHTPTPSPIVDPTPTPTVDPTPTPTPTPTPIVDPTPTPTPIVDPTPTPVPPTPSPSPSSCATPGSGGAVDASYNQYPYKVGGTATLKTLTKGSIPLSGLLSLRLCLPAQTLSGDLTLDPASAKLTALGFLPVSAKVNIAQTEKVVGTVRNNELVLVAKVRIKLPSVKVLGIELAGGANCQAKQISSITLKSTQQEFLPTEGGPVAGTFAISNLT
ncbi:MAG: hypothetical protein Q7T55_23670, partial [Solirubrobacteraceae bacterium]|nr:hypothetical protein [Solirubrobacteraceae bacterium]